MSFKEEQSLFPVGNVLRDNQIKVNKQLKNRMETLKTEKDVLDMRDNLNINSDFSVEKSEFKKTLLPKLVDLSILNSSSDEHGRLNIQTKLSLLNVILFNDYEVGKSKLCKSAITANLIQNLDAIDQATNSTGIKQLIIDALLLLSLIESDGNKVIQKSMKPNTNLMISLTIRILSDSDKEDLIKESLILLQYFICQSKKYETISPVLSALIKLLKHDDRSVISQSLYTILVFSQSFREARKALIEANVGPKLMDLWTDSVEEELVKPIFSIIKTLLARLNEYKNYFLSSKLNILDIIPKLCSSTDLNKIFATEIVTMIAMKPLSAQFYTSTEQINTIIKYQTIKQISNLLETDPSPAVRSSALDAIFTVVYNSDWDQLKQLVEQDCLRVLCTQFATTDEKHLAQTVLSVAVFLLEEFKDILKNQKMITDPKKTLTPFATIVKGTDGFNHLNRLNRERIEKEKKFNAGIPDWKLKFSDYNVGYKATDTEKMIEELMVYCFGVGEHYRTRKPSMEIMAEDKSTIACVECPVLYSSLANTDIFSCGHISHCKKCASSAVHKVYKDLINETNPKKCPVEGCKDRIPSSACPLWMFRTRLFKEYKRLHDNLEREIHPEIVK